MNASETYNGYTNRETWAVALWLSNDEGMYHDARYLATRAFDGSDQYDERDAAADIREYVEQILATGSPLTGETRDSMSRDVGSLWRVDWDEVVASLRD